MANATIHAPDCMRGITLKVTGLRALKLRVRLAAWIFQFGAWVAGCNITMTDGQA